ncbi:MAG: NADH-quinone oxidoreductase subunit J [Bacteroidales bacterium]|nr:NADH-quinone oxidoreductase subunit J [Bacteroidales bacterium]MDD4821495.1 NADH-quinone oxidoreductase subunit J [Bacteroidales bacterium]
MTLNEVVFYLLSAVIVVCSILTVTTTRILRSATYLLFVLFATAGLYFQMNYSFMGAVQLTVYAGGVIVLYVFSILLTSSPGGDNERPKMKYVIAGLSAVVAGALLSIYIILSHSFPTSKYVAGEIDMKMIGQVLMGTEKYQYLLPFEAVSVLLLACIVGGILIARKR